MKTTIIALLTATFLGFASYLGARHFDATDFLAIAFVSGLVAWTFDQYRETGRKVEPFARTIKFEAKRAAARTCTRDAERLAA